MHSHFCVISPKKEADAFRPIFVIFFFGVIWIFAAARGMRTSILQLLAVGLVLILVLASKTRKLTLNGEARTLEYQVLGIKKRYTLDQVSNADLDRKQSGKESYFVLTLQVPGKHLQFDSTRYIGVTAFYSALCEFRSGSGAALNTKHEDYSAPIPAAVYRTSVTEHQAGRHVYREKRRFSVFSLVLAVLFFTAAATVGSAIYIGYPVDGSMKELVDTLSGIAEIRVSGSIIGLIVCIAASVLLMVPRLKPELLGERFRERLLERDREHVDLTVNPVYLWLTAGQCAALLGVLWLSFGRFVPLMVVVLILFALDGLLTATTNVTLEGQEIHIRRLCFTKKLPLSSLLSARWLPGGWGMQADILGSRMNLSLLRFRGLYHTQLVLDRMARQRK